LIDEINRAPAKTQSALFEVMEERQITVDGYTHRLQEPFIVIATQNPVEHEGTYRLPEAQLDRFLFKIEVKYPTLEEEIEILTRQHQHKTAEQIAAVTIIAGVNCILEKCASMLRAISFAVSVLATPGTPSISRCPSARMPAISRSTLSFWHEQHNNSNIAQKKVTYFLEHIRTKHFIRTNLLNDDFVDLLAHKSGVSKPLRRMLQEDPEN